jgi:hypothetical protein
MWHNLLLCRYIVNRKYRSAGADLASLIRRALPARAATVKWCWYVTVTTAARIGYGQRLNCLSEGFCAFGYKAVPATRRLGLHRASAAALDGSLFICPLSLWCCRLLCLEALQTQLRVGPHWGATGTTYMLVIDKLPGISFWPSTVQAASRLFLLALAARAQVVLALVCDVAYVCGGHVNISR